MPENETDCLVIPDIHQHIAWADAILASEASAVGRVVFLGDYFDRKLSHAASAFETAQYISELESAYPAFAFNFLVGNHDLPYLFGLQNPSATVNPYSNGAFDPSLTEGIKCNLRPNFVSSLAPFTLAHGFLLSHAGLHRKFLPAEQPTEADLEQLSSQLTPQLANLPVDPTAALADIGFSRGGLAPNGGITWQDWHHEFEDSLPWPQIVGHTILSSPSQSGRSWNLDTKTGNYAILSGGDIEIRSLDKSRTR